MSVPLHGTPHPSAGRTVAIVSGRFAGCLYRIEDWYDRVAHRSWMNDSGSPAAWKYACRAAADHLPLGNEVLYGKIDGLGELVHVSELAADDNEGEAQP